jgi:hypothetical protein
MKPKVRARATSRSVGVFREVDDHRLPGAVNRRMIETNREAQAKTIVGLETRPFLAGLVALADFDRTRDADELLGDSLLFDSGRLDQEDKRRRRAVKNRHFGGIQIDKGVVDAEAGECRHQVFDGTHLGTVDFQARTHARVADEHRRCRQVDDRIEIEAPKDDARRRAQPAAGTYLP